MNKTEKLLRAFIEAQGYEIENITSAKDEDVLAMKLQGFDIVYDDYKVTKKEKVYSGDLFSLGCQVANDDIRKTLSSLGFDLDKNQMHDLMEIVIFHIER